MFSECSSCSAVRMVCTLQHSWEILLQLSHKQQEFDLWSFCLLSHLYLVCPDSRGWVNHSMFWTALFPQMEHWSENRKTRCDCLGWIRNMHWSSIRTEGLRLVWIRIGKALDNWRPSGRWYCRLAAWMPCGLRKGHHESISVSLCASTRVLDSRCFGSI